MTKRMASSDENFKFFCGKDINELANGRQPHLLRRTAAQLYHEACRLKKPEHSTAAYLMRDLEEYYKASSDVLAKKFEAFAKEKSLTIRTSGDRKLEHFSQPWETVKACKSGQHECISKIRDEDVAKLFTSTVCNRTETSARIEKHSARQNTESDKTISFNLSFNRIKSQAPRTCPQNNQQIGLTKNCPDALHDAKSEARESTGHSSYAAANTRTQDSLNYSYRQSTSNNKRRWINDGNNDTGAANKNRYHNRFNDTNQAACVAPAESHCPNDKNEVASFRTGTDELQSRYDKKYCNAETSQSNNRKTLGGRRTVQSKFVPPFAQEQQQQAQQPQLKGTSTETPCIDERLKHIEPKMIELIRSEIMERFTHVSWDDIAGLEYAKSTIQEAVVWPILRPDIFTGLRRPPRGILLFGPPGTGKTLIGKCIASQSKSTFFSISASSLTSKWIGEGEKMVRALFAVAVVHQPAVIFIDEIDSLLCQRSETEHESSRRIKTEFLVQLDGAATGENERVLIVGATNRPQELDEAARRRLVKRLYIPLPELSARIQILANLLKSDRSDLTNEQMSEIGKMTEGFSGADMKVLCHEASMEPIRSIPHWQMSDVDVNDVRAVNYSDFRAALQKVRSSVSPADLKHYIEWNRTYGSGSDK